jgi:tetratricopeptide (TPR) repeat protein
MRKRAVILVSLILFFPNFVRSGEERPEKEPSESKQRAEQLYNTGYLLSLLGQYEEAIRLFDKSIEIEPTAEAYTYKGWTYSHMGDFDRAIEEAEKAIRIDPDFGNPYNDIGVYLIELGKDEAAVGYLEKAVKAKRYCCHQFPHFNIGRIYLKKKQYDKAREEFRKSLAVDPDYEPARQGLEILEQTGLKET